MAACAVSDETVGVSEKTEKENVRRVLLMRHPLLKMLQCFSAGTRKQAYRTRKQAVSFLTGCQWFYILEYKEIIMIRNDKM